MVDWISPRKHASPAVLVLAYVAPVLHCNSLTRHVQVHIIQSCVSQRIQVVPVTGALFGTVPNMTKCPFCTCVTDLMDAMLKLSFFQTFKRLVC